MCLRNKVLKTRGYVRNFTYLDAANITSKQKFDMTKVAISIHQKFNRFLIVAFCVSGLFVELQLLASDV